ncbi:PAS domain S-box-containing protein [Caulobacter ginsengisoli]|uniref:histidine kinase n=1 Tax=Caulobacter ginsengisoli TaxID=400775 RepID=A0ABU0IS74_9CAUL|nr:ATP-binding protein [Caulobacter ginsengisoli]MDQ0464862.1 PAS domain S-box-containing protein [Caulobacter ginsengisoli]
MAEKTPDEIGSRAPSELDIEAARWFFQNTDDVFLVLEGSLITRINPAWTALAGWSDADTVGRAIEDFLHPDDGVSVQQVIDDLNASGSALAEHRLAHSNGDWLWVKSRAKRSADGATIVVLKDVTAEHEEAEAAETAHRTSELLRNAAGIFTWKFNPDTGIYLVDADLPAQTTPGGPGSRVLSADQMGAEIHKDDRADMWTAFATTLATGEPQVIEYRHQVEGGPVARLRAAWRGLRRLDSGKWEILGITQDVTEVAEARDAAREGERAAQAAAEAKSQFLANMSHEIRTPMNGVLGVLHLLKGEALSADGRRLLEEAVGCGQMLAELLNDVIDFSKVEAGHLELHPEPVEAGILLTSVADLLRPQAESRGLWLRAIAQPDLGWVDIDPVRLRQILFNLIGNAVKFTLEGGVEVRLSHRDARLRIEVQDTGVGISETAQAGLFQRFHQADGSTTRRFGGSGLGLAITRRLADLMGGEIGFASEAGSGSTFWVELAAPRVAGRAASPSETGDLLEGLSVLVVDDNATNRLIATRMLENLGAQVQTAEDGAEALAAAGQVGFDLIFMDIQMPVMDGMEATRHIRALPAPLCQIPIIAMTANALAHQVQSYLAAGMNASVAKPLSPAALIATIARLASEAEEQRTDAA